MKALTNQENAAFSNWLTAQTYAAVIATERTILCGPHNYRALADSLESHLLTSVMRHKRAIEEQMVLLDQSAYKNSGITGRPSPMSAEDALVADSLADIHTLLVQLKKAIMTAPSTAHDYLI